MLKIADRFIYVGTGQNPVPLFWDDLFVIRQEHGKGTSFIRKDNSRVSVKDPSFNKIVAALKKAFPDSVHFPIVNALVPSHSLSVFKECAGDLYLTERTQTGDPFLETRRDNVRKSLSFSARLRLMEKGLEDKPATIPELLDAIRKFREVDPHGMPMQLLRPLQIHFSTLHEQHRLDELETYMRQLCLIGPDYTRMCIESGFLRKDTAPGFLKWALLQLARHPDASFINHDVKYINSNRGIFMEVADAGHESLCGVPSYYHTSSTHFDDPEIFDTLRETITRINNHYLVTRAIRNTAIVSSNDSPNYLRRLYGHLVGIGDASDVVLAMGEPSICRDRTRENCERLRWVIRMTDIYLRRAGENYASELNPMWSNLEHFFIGHDYERILNPQLFATLLESLYKRVVELFNFVKSSQDWQYNSLCCRILENASWWGDRSELFEPALNQLERMTAKEQWKLAKNADSFTANDNVLTHPPFFRVIDRVARNLAANRAASSSNVTECLIYISRCPYVIRTDELRVLVADRLRDIGEIDALVALQRARFKYL